MKPEKTYTDIPWEVVWQQGCHLGGTGHVQDFTTADPAMIIGSDDIEVTKLLVSELNSTLIRFYYGQDLIGCGNVLLQKRHGYCRRHA